MNNQVKSAQTVLVKCAIVVGFTMAMIAGERAEANTTTDGCSATAGYPCTHNLELEAYPLSRVPTTFKFQARISQAKLPVGDVKFPKIIVLIKNGDTTECREELTNVAVYDSVLNLEIGANMSCDMDEIIAKYDNLGIDVCIANDQNCLKRVKLSAVPYAVKSTYAFEAAKADKANHAVECHYAHRVAADANLFDAKSIGTGFYNFHTPTDLDLLMGGIFEGQSVPEKYYRGGYIQWAPVTNDDANLHICKMHVDAATDTPMTLEELFLHAKATHMTGVATVWGDQTSGTTDFTVKGDSLIEENQTVVKNQNVNQNLAVGGHAVIGQGEQTLDYSTYPDGLDVFGLGAFHHSVTVDVNLDVIQNFTAGGTADVTGATTLGNTLAVTGGTTLNSNLDVVGPSTLSSTLDVTNAATFGDTLTTTGQIFANGGLDVQNGASVTGDATFNNKVAVNAGGLEVSGSTQINDNLSVGTVSTGNNRNMNIHHDTTFRGGVHFEEADVTGLIENMVLGSDNIGIGTIGSDQIENNSVTSTDIHDGTIAAADLAPGADTHAGSICSVNQVLTGDGTCKTYQVDTNATSQCANDKFLRGDGVCVGNPLQENGHISSRLYADAEMHVSDNNGGSLVNFKTTKTDASYAYNNYYWGANRTAYMLWRNDEYFQLHADQAKTLLFTGGKVYIDPGSPSNRSIQPSAELHVKGSSYIDGDSTVTGSLKTQDLVLEGKFTDGTDWALATDPTSQESLVIMEPEENNKIWARFKDDDGLYLEGAPNLYAKGNVTVGKRLTTKSLTVTDKIATSNIGFKTRELNAWKGSKSGDKVTNAHFCFITAMATGSGTQSSNCAIAPDSSGAWVYQFQNVWVCTAFCLLK